VWGPGLVYFKKVVRDLHMCSRSGWDGNPWHRPAA
jgi:hypothetical protein